MNTTQPRRLRRQFAGVLLGIAGGGAVALYAAAQAWLVRHTARPAPLAPEVVRHSGADLAPLLPALALLALAGAAGIVASRGALRAAICALVVAAGAGMLATTVTLLTRTGVSIGWAIAECLAASAVMAGGLMGVRHGARWPTLAARHERAQSQRGVSRPAPRRSQARGGDAVTLWDAIERGEDPTSDASGPR